MLAPSLPAPGAAAEARGEERLPRREAVPWRGLGLGFEAGGAGGWDPLVDSVGEMDMNPRGSSWG